MNGNSQKTFVRIAIIILATVFVVFVSLFFTGKIGDFMGVMSDSSSSSEQEIVESNISSAESAQGESSAPEESVTSSQQSTVNSQQSTVSSQQSTVSSQQSTASTPQSTQSSSQTSVQSSSSTDSKPTIFLDYSFRNNALLVQHYDKHGREMGFKNKEEYEKAASAVVNNPNALHKTEKEDGDDVYYIESTNEFVVVSKGGFIRTYFNPDRGIDYFNAQ